jgi:hypothetical protein
MSFNKRILSAGAAPFKNSKNFKAITYAGNGGTQAITGLGFQPDFVWIKNRTSNGQGPLIQDSTRGTGSTKVLFSSETSLEGTYGQYGHVSAFGTDGFTVVDGDGEHVNSSNKNYVAWCWRANGGTTSTNTDGSINSTVQTNTDAGFSIIKYTGNGTAGATIGHNLGVVPDMFIVKRLSGSGTWNWRVYHKDTHEVPEDYNIALNGHAARFDRTEWNDTAPTSTVFSVDNHGSVNENGEDYICYAFENISGFANFGSYEGNSSDDGPIVETGFEPAFLMIRNASDAGSWFIYDNARNTTNPRKNYLHANTTNQEASDLNGVDFLSNGFKILEDHDDVNDTGDRYIYMAFAADPDTEAPTLASSFNIETYTGTGAANSITGLGFKPDLVWIKDRGNAEQHVLNDSLRGATKDLSSNTTAAEATRATGFTSFDSDGFTLGTDGGGLVNDSSRGPYVAWTWKADDNEPTLTATTSDADPVSIYKFEDNSNDVRGNNNGSDSNISYSSSGKFNKAAEFNGSNSKITLSSGDIITSADFTLSMWLTNDNSGSYKEIFSQQTNNSKGFYFGKASNDTDFRLGDGIGDIPLSVGTNFEHIVVAVSGSNAKVYKNANKIYDSNSFSFKASSHTVGANSGTILGNQWGSIYSEYWDGKIDQFRIFNGQQLNQASIRKLYNETASQNDTVNIGTTYNTSLEALVSANANAGFSIVKWTGTGANVKVPHGLSATPELIISKNRDTAATDGWPVFTTSIGNDHTLFLNTTAAKTSTGGTWGSTSPTSSVFTVQDNDSNNQSGNEIIAYCWHSVSGYSKIGTFSGNSSTQSITGVGFQPDWIMIKRTDGTENWYIQDSTRGSTKQVYANLNSAEFDETGAITSFDTDGWTMGSYNGINNSGESYVYMAFKIN